VAFFKECSFLNCLKEKKRKKEKEKNADLGVCMGCIL
jgi:hypothetical protein